MNKFYFAAIGSLALSASLLLGSVAIADVQGADQSTKPVQALTQKKLSRKELKKLNGVECKRVRETGSRISKKVCSTAAQRQASARREEDKVNALEDRAILDSPSGS